MNVLRLAPLFAVALALCVHAAEPTALSESATRQAALQRAFESVRTKLTLVAGRLETSDDPRDKERAANIRKALALASERDTATKFQSFLRTLTTGKGAIDLDNLTTANREVQALRADLKLILALLNEDGADAALKKRELELKELLERLKRLKIEERKLQNASEAKKEDTTKLADAQDKLREETKQLATQKKAPDKAKTALGRAEGKMGKASRQLRDGESGDAALSQADAEADIDEAIDEVERELNNNQQEQRERKLRDLLARCMRMLGHQREVRDGVTALNKQVGDGEVTSPAQRSRASKSSDVQLTSLREMDGVLQLVREEETAVAFAEVFDQIHKDMDVLKRRLDRLDLGRPSVQVADDIVVALEEVIKALQKELQKQQPGGGGGGGGGNPRTPPLVTHLQQLKMIFAMQRRVHARTELYGKHYQGEQAPREATPVQKELSDLATRQKRIHQVTRELSTQEARR
jgi:hypothetical protein